MNKKFIALATVLALLLTATLAIAPQSEAKTIKEDFGANICSNDKIYYGTYTPTEDVTIDSISSTYVFKWTDSIETKLLDSMKNGKNFYEIGELVIDKELKAGEKYFIADTGKNWIYLYDKEKKQIGPIELSGKTTNEKRLLEIKMSTANGDNVSITMNFNYSEILEGCRVYVVNKVLLSSIESKGVVKTGFMEDNKKLVMDSSDITETTTLSFKSGGVNDYYIVIAMPEDTEYNVMLPVNGSVEIKGLADTGNPLPFAVVMFVISIAVVGGIVYIARKKVIE